MRILFVTSEVAGLYKLGGLGDVSRALPLSLTSLGVHVTIILPFYEEIPVNKPHCLGTLGVDFDKKREIVFIFETTLPDSQVPVLLLRHPYLNTYHSDHIQKTFAFYDKAVTTLVAVDKALLGFDFDIVHCHDWHTGLVPLLVGENNKISPQKATLQASSSKTILTIHNLLYQGETQVDLMEKLAVPKGLFHLIQGKKEERMNMLREGLEYADIISTVSPTYAKEIMNPEYGEGLWEVIKRREDRVVGILNGIETHVWKPNYTASSVLSAKPKLKTQLQQTLGLPRTVDAVLFGFVGRLEPLQKGIDILLSAIERLDGHEAMQVAVLGTGHLPMVKTLKTLIRKHPRNIAFVNAFDEKLARSIYAGSDILLVPSKFEPCGLTQMIAMRYGTIPLVRKTGGLADSVKNRKTGFVFGPYTKTALVAAMKNAITLYQQDRSAWQAMIVRCMKKDFSWEKSGQKYKALYRKLMAGR